jgi:glyoxylase-like metal-dependent hydrolase (beta-lactamase superfamily II)
MIHILDLRFLDSTSTIAAFLIEAGDEYILVETGPHSTLPQLERAAAEHGVELKAIQHVFLTHIHFDHAGAAWALAKNGATIYLHPRGKKHLHDPTRLYESARRIYQDKMEYLWGKMEGIPEAQLRTCEHEEVIDINGLSIKALHTPGHAVHHIAWRIGNAILTGDVAGVRIKEELVVPPCPPPDIHVEDWKHSLTILRKEQAEVFYLTHFGKVENIEKHLDDLETLLLDWANWMKPHAEADRSVQEIIPEFTAYVQEQLKVAGITDAADLERYEKANPSWMSVAGLMRYWKKHGDFEM